MFFQTETGFKDLQLHFSFFRREKKFNASWNEVTCTGYSLENLRLDYRGPDSSYPAISILQVCMIKYLPDSPNLATQIVSCEYT